jgi:hypothetical protein
MADKKIQKTKTIQGKIEEKTVATPADWHKEQMEALNLIHAFRGGSKAMRELIPRDDGEEDIVYASRKKRSMFTNFFWRTVEKLAGEVFSIPITLDDAAKEAQGGELTEWHKDVDRQGHDLNRFCYELFCSGLEDGITFLLVDYPSVELRMIKNVLYYYEAYEGEADKEGEWLLLTREVEKKKGWRPFWTLVKVENLIGGKWEIKNGRVVFTQIRIREFAEEEDGLFHTTSVEQIRVLYIGRWEVWRKDEEASKASGKEEWIIHDEGQTTQSYIPLVPLSFGRKINPLCSAPPLDPLADLNFIHFLSHSDQRNVMHYARLVIWFAKGLDVVVDSTGKKKSIKWGGNRLVHSDKEYGDLKAVEFKGDAIEAGFKDLEQLKQDMALFGLTFLMSKASGNVTATGKILDKAENISALTAWALNFESGINEAIRYTKEWMQFDDLTEKSGQAIVNREFKNILADVSAKILLEATEKNILPQQIFMEELIRRNYIDEKWEYADIKKLLMAEQRESIALDGFSGQFDNEVEDEDDDDNSSNKKSIKK